MTIQVGNDSSLDSGGSVEYLECGTEKTWEVIGWGCRWGPEASVWKGLRVMGSKAVQELNRPRCCWVTPSYLSSRGQEEESGVSPEKCRPVQHT